MKVGIIGTGSVGSALGTSLIRAGHEVTLGARNAEKTRKVAAEIGASTATPVETARVADVIVLAVPYTQAASVVREIAAVASGKVVIDATNPLKADYSGLATEGGPSGAERLAAIAPSAKFVKAFNTIFASIQANPASHGQVIDALLAGDDADAKATVATLARSIGLRPVDAGALAGARELEAMAWLNIALQLRTGGNWDSTFVLVGAPEKAIAA